MKVKKPWGWYEVLAKGKGWKLKLISLNPHSRTSLQSHKLRDEFWVYIYPECFNKLLATFFRRTKFIKPGQKHRLENNHRFLIKVIELQHGRCLESDVIRYSDDYGRVKK